MTISTQTFRFSYVSTGGTTYAYTNKILSENDLTVYVDDVLQTLSTHYTVSGVGEAAGGNVVFLVAPAAASVVLITKDGVEFTQETDYVENDAFPAESHENALDKLTNIAQKIWDYTRRSIKLPITSSLIDIELPTPEANKVIGWNATADNFQNLSLTGIGAISDEAYNSTTWDAVDEIAPSKNAVRDKLEAMISDTAYNSTTWNGVSTIAPSKNAVRDEFESMRATIITDFATAAEITTGTEAAKAIAPDQLALTKYGGDWSWWGIKNLRLIDVHAGDATRVVVNPDAYTIPLLIGAHWHVMTAAVDVDSVDDLDTGTLAAGTDYYVYACTDGTTLSFKVSANATNPTGFDASHSRKIGGFHTLCVAVGAIAGHTLTNYAVKDILPASIWDLKHRAKNLVNVGMVYDSKIQKWVDIYLASGTGASTTSVNGGTISDTRNWMDFVDDGLAVGKRLLTDTEFTSAAAGSNEETNITGNADPGTTSGHVDSAGRRMISNIGCEDCCGVVWQWLQDQSYYYYGATPYYGNLPGGKGSTYTQFAADPGATEVDNSDSAGDVKLVAGGNWGDAAGAGSRSRVANYYRWVAVCSIGARFCSEPL